ncbi:uncharacterized protein LOC128230897 isoform X1 [Mya arenaria]|nr:uncharacterized protein LOC128230897 isoform X1 [Mya arenaria]XP_052799293.1 uncharacterized protein LOC128230897 isoform X1 [Mya arenaria]XP_052799299.1 uncharacterized protein LOC128230897 isoform X1 [Mya arenaria]XP_052799305.1 uncharacterized protein LOC128230897 isoform X1 [Mya arenaria]
MIQYLNFCQRHLAFSEIERRKAEMDSIHSYDEKTISFQFIDEHAKKASSKDAVSFKTLIEYLRIPCDRLLERDLYLARAIAVWISTNVHSTDDPENDRRSLSELATTPKGCMQLLRRKEFKEWQIFQKLFDTAGIQHHVVEGRVKNIQYRAGDKEFATNKWMYFSSFGHLHLMHPGWLVKAVASSKHSDEVELEASSEITQKRRSTDLRDTVDSTLNDFWFCTRPDIFATRCLPNDSVSQLLPTPSRFSFDRFVEIADRRREFYSRKLTLLCKNTCCIETHDGECSISLFSVGKSGQRLEFFYNFAMHEEQDRNQREGTPERSAFKDMVLPHVLHEPTAKSYRDTFTFDVRCPQKGEYWLRLMVGSSGENDISNCCEFKIISDSPRIHYKFPPRHSLSVCGYGPKAEKARLKEPSVKGGMITVEVRDDPEMEEILSFGIADSDGIDHIEDGSDTLNDPDNGSDEIVNYETELYGSDFDGEDGQIQSCFQDCTRTSKDLKKQKVFFYAKIPKAGEYSLVIYATWSSIRDDHIRREAVACYFLTTDEVTKAEGATNVENIDRISNTENNGKENRSCMDDHFVGNEAMSFNPIGMLSVCAEEFTNKREKRIQLRKEEKCVLLSNKGREFLEKLRKEHNGDINFNITSEGDLIIPTRNIYKREHLQAKAVVESIKIFLSEATTYRRRVSLDDAEYHFLEMYCKDTLQAASVIFVPDVKELVITGTLEHVGKSVELITHLKRGIRRKVERVCKEGLYTFLISENGKNHLENIEREMESVIIIEGFENSFDGELESVTVRVLAQKSENLETTLQQLRVVELSHPLLQERNDI